MSFNATMQRHPGTAEVHPRGKKRKTPPRHTSHDQMMAQSNSTVNAFVGGGRKSWMNTQQGPVAPTPRLSHVVPSAASSRRGPPRASSSPTKQSAPPLQRPAVATETSGVNVGTVLGYSRPGTQTALPFQPQPRNIDPPSTHQTSSPQVHPLNMGSGPTHSGYPAQTQPPNLGPSSQPASFPHPLGSINTQPRRPSVLDLASLNNPIPTTVTTQSAPSPLMQTSTSPHFMPSPSTTAGLYSFAFSRPPPAIPAPTTPRALPSSNLSQSMWAAPVNARTLPGVGAQPHYTGHPGPTATLPPVGVHQWNGGWANGVAGPGSRAVTIRYPQHAVGPGQSLAELPAGGRSWPHKTPSAEQAGFGQHPSSMPAPAFFQYHSRPVPRMDHRPLIPPGAQPVRMTHPKPATGALHLCRTLTPPMSPKERPNGSLEPCRMYQYVKGFVLRPQMLDLKKTPSNWIFEFFQEIQRGPQTIFTQKDIAASVKYLVKSGDCTFRVRCCEVEAKEFPIIKPSVWLEKKVKWPNHLFPWINGAIASLRRGSQFGQDLPLDATPFVRVGRNILSLNIHPSSEESKQLYAIAAEMVEVLSHDDIVTGCQRNSVVSSAERHQAIVAHLTSSALNEADDELAVVSSSVTVDLTDPFMSKIFDIPARTVDCRHHDCFDLETFLKTRPPHRKYDGAPSAVDVWKCPRCGADARPPQLRIDGFLQEVRRDLAIKGLLLDAKAIKITETGWEVVESKKTGARQKQGAVVEVDAPPEAVTKSPKKVKKTPEAALEVAKKSPKKVKKTPEKVVIDLLDD